MDWYRVEPLADVWPNPTPADERRSRYTFKATFSDTLSLLSREIRMLDPHRSWEATQVVMQVACHPGDIRKGGGIRTDARQFDHPGVRIAFNTPDHGTLTYETDACELWQHNVRSLALGLEALRAVSRHGIASSGQQYTGFKALPAGRAMPASHMTSEQARNVLYGLSGYAAWSEASPSEHYKNARRVAHPDRHRGDRAMWDQVEEAAKVLRLLP